MKQAQERTRMLARRRCAAISHGRAWLLVGGLACGFMGCAGGGEKAGEPVTVEQLPAYPEIEQGRTVDVQVFRRGTNITLTNSTGETLPSGRLWINRWFGQDVEAIGVGETVTYSLKSFRDTYGDTFRAGGFFATRRPETLVQAQLQTTEEMIGLVVVGER